MNDIQEIAMMKHRIAILLIKKQTTETYLESVTGKLNIFESDLIDVDQRVWPMQVQSLMLTHQKSSSAAATASSSTTTAATTMATDKEKKQIICENLLHQQLKEIDQSLKQYEKQLNNKQNSVIGFTSKMEEIVDSYVQQYGIKPIKIKCDLKIALIKYNYQSELLQRKFSQEQPNRYQLKGLLDTKRQEQKSKRELFELKQRIFYNKLSMVTLSNEQMATLLRTNVQQRLVVNKEEKFIYYKKLDLLAEQLRKAEEQYYFNQYAFDHDFSRMWHNHRQHGYVDNNNLQSTSSNMIIATNQHGLNDKQLQLLNRGPTYIPLCQIKALRTEIQTKIEDQFRYLFSNSTPSDLQQQRALYEKNLIQTIRSSLKKNNLILRRLSMAYELLSSNEGQKHYDLNKRIESMNILLEKLREKKALDNNTVN
ncbi:unnamed protein product [Rotaria sp. Silwood1]|nr:unnamed protein product [Rotaria sp. Silwood1]CAF5026017.1 unnamed protein product [Rotaria sp. Silwood1]